MKNLFIVTSIIGLVLIGYFYFNKSNQSIEKLVSHFEASGFVVRTVYLSQKEKEGVEEFKEFLIDLGAENNTIVDSQLKYINNIEVKFTLYKNSKVSKEDYERQVASKASTKIRAEKNNDEYYHTDYFLNDEFIMTIHHFDTALDFRKIKLNISKTELDKIVETFDSF